jgi:murein DD-endopeptidase MepM/ murein hydrolase activator NlpD
MAGALGEEGSMKGAGARRWWRPGLIELVRRLLPERQLMVRSRGQVRLIVLSRFRQLLILGFAVVIFGGVVVASANLFADKLVLRAKDAEIARVRVAFRNLISQVAESQNRFTSAADTLRQNHEYLLDLVDQNSALRRDIEIKEKKAELSRINRIRSGRRAVKNHLRWLEEERGETYRWDIKPAVPGTGQLPFDKIMVGGDAAAQAIDPLKLWDERAAVEKRERDIQRRLLALRDSQRKILFRLTERAIRNISAVEKTIAMTGLDLEGRLTASAGNLKGQGGPFVAAPAAPAGPAGSDLFERDLVVLDRHIQRFDELQRVVRTIPFAEPSRHYYVSSRFGRRRDPINGKWAMHSGADLAGTLGSPILTTAEGTVLFAGHNGRYGRMVEIDHGFGLRTRYGHLQRILVKKGQKVSFHQEIGLMGTSGRSTGPHVHYEIVVDGVPLNPIRFLNAGKYVFER